MAKRLIGWGVVWATASAAAFVLLDPIVAAFIAILGLCVWGVAALASDWDRHSSFEQRELDRARRRAERHQRGKGARERDRARWEAHQQRRRDRSTR